MADSNPSTIIFISNDQREIHKVRQWSHNEGYHIKTLTSLQWQKGFSNPHFKSTLMADLHVQSQQEVSPQEIATGQVLPFPSSSPSTKMPSSSTPTINDIKKKVIEETVSKFYGNLAQASMALGIGRATLYRKVKQYNIDLPQCRRNKAEAKAKAKAKAKILKAA